VYKFDPATFDKVNEQSATETYQYDAVPPYNADIDYIERVEELLVFLVTHGIIPQSVLDKFRAQNQQKLAEAQAAEATDISNAEYNSLLGLDAVSGDPDAPSVPYGTVNFETGDCNGVEEISCAEQLVEYNKKKEAAEQAADEKQLSDETNPDREPEDMTSAFDSEVYFSESPLPSLSSMYAGGDANALLSDDETKQPPVPLGPRIQRLYNSVMESNKGNELTYAIAQKYPHM
jgi:hypothetical protein